MENDLTPRFVTIDVTHYDVPLLAQALRRDGYADLAVAIEADYAKPVTYVGHHRPEREVAA